MSSNSIQKITVIIAFLLPLLSTGKSYDVHRGICKTRKGENITLVKCKEYIECGKDGHLHPAHCEDGKIFDANLKKCTEDTEPPCRDDYKVVYRRWSVLNYTDEHLLLNGSIPKANTTEYRLIKNFESLPENHNKSKQYIMLQTSFLSAAKGKHTFSTTCTQSCKIWIRKNLCEPRELILEQSNHTYQGERVTYKVQKGYKLEFKKFYYLDVVLTGGPKYSKFEIKVKWNSREGPNPGNVVEDLIKLPPNDTKEKCKFKSSTSITPGSSRPTITVGSLRPTTTLGWVFTGTSTVMKTVSLNTQHSFTRSPTSSSVVTMFSAIKPTSTLTTYATQELSKPSLGNLSKQVEKIAENWKKGTPFSNNDGLSQPKKVDLISKKIAENWNEKGQSYVFYKNDLVMKISYPEENYTFPLKENFPNVTSDFEEDQIYIPAHVLVNETGEYDRKIFSVLYPDSNDKTPTLFNVIETGKGKRGGSFQLNSRIIASTAVPAISGLKDYYIIIRLRHLKTNVSSNNKPLCAFIKWRNESDNSDGVWSTEGCIRDEPLSNTNITVCRCNHLTHFGVLIQVTDEEISPTDIRALTAITYVGSALSLIGVFFTVLAITCLPGARSERNFIHVNLAIAIACVQIVFLAGIEETENEVLCTVVAAFLHYFLLVAFSWMLIEGIFLHILIVKVFHDHLPRRRYYMTFSWGLPLVIVVASVIVFRDGFGTESACWLSTEKSTIWTFAGPAILVMIVNMVVLCKVMKEINSLRDSDQRDANVRSIRYGVRSTIILLPLLGLTWAFGLIGFNQDTVVFQYLFTVFNSLQGLFIFLFHCVFNSEVRKAFWRKVDIWFTNHGSQIAINQQYGSSIKKSHGDHSPVSTGANRIARPNNGVLHYSFDVITERRKLSSITASTCVDNWPHKFSLTPSMDVSYPPRLSPLSVRITFSTFPSMCKKRIGKKVQLLILMALITP
ncbi:adhesion G protein-coupled receptor L4-like [Xenia sp. Carnegie-2017]|uniref:adhesion G protein-coupled receptor L4-like n=1 Tax=Xenia sp. Carnegie-2017 TaxID=2897299 RepID=UPI001F037EFD|nr:adhesion G protein-coupled receptor L4-like [Xenia sp. Carnegie-2017]XP_046845838.1 adhesion G protein-coupled receptor L4-like [Xenia sp. Carnegie-2017]XP_046845839.1 adhesion G protein-coupled receptor L4-like [Xenia sp. Carnegie-2017]XP_046845840.1 adhesion G protein-coupled receptor L4-like [Xenia sp. Carnegie-2017]XP_046845841.1 adhesion G protein-coupled receptor L4-like [Xenia sp. Carnegie-2017]XP_046845842.1 adhesion G protein-coupled receptor L4-like [Xenia sp. Carnegie-2017]